MKRKVIITLLGTLFVIFLAQLDGIDEFDIGYIVGVLIGGTATWIYDLVTE